MKKIIFLLAVACLLFGGYRVQAAVLTPTAVLNKAYDQMLKWKTINMRGAYTLNLPVQEYNDQGKLVTKMEKTVTTFNISADETNPDDLKAQMRLDLASSMYKVGLDALFVGNDYYFSFALNDKGAEFLKALKLEKYQDSWVWFNMDDLRKKILGSEYASIGNELERINTDLTASQRKQLMASLKKNNVLNLKVLKSGKVGGQEAYHYGFTVNYAGLKKFMAESTKLLNGESLSSSELASLDKSLRSVKYYGEFWVSKKTFDPLRIIVRSEKPYMFSKTMSTMSLDIFFNNINKPIFVAKPANVVPVEEVLNAVLSNFNLGGISTSTKGI